MALKDLIKEFASVSHLIPTKEHPKPRASKTPRMRAGKRCLFCEQRIENRGPHQVNHHGECTRKWRNYKDRMNYSKKTEGADWKITLKQRGEYRRLKRLESKLKSTHPAA